MLIPSYSAGRVNCGYSSSPSPKESVWRSARHRGRRAAGASPRRYDDGGDWRCPVRT